MNKKLSYLLLLLFSFAGISQSHPLGIFSVNRYTRIELSRDAIRLIYVMDVAEIPSIQEFTKIDVNANGVADEQERNRYAEAKLAEIAEAFRLTADGNQVNARPIAYDLSFPEGQGGLKTTRLTSTFEAPLSGDIRTHDVSFVDHNFDDRIGWKEIVVRPLSGAGLDQSSVGTEDVTDELQNYPADRLSNPEDI